MKKVRSIESTKVELNDKEFKIREVDINNSTPANITGEISFENIDELS